MARGTLTNINATVPFGRRMSELVLTEDRGPVRHVVLNRPEKRNAFHGELVLATGAALRAAADDPAVRCVVLRGAGPMFSSGMDLGALGALAEAPEHLRAFRRHCIEAWNLAEEMPKPVICAIQGACIGGALELALACDFRVLAADAIVGMPETRIGLIPDVGGSSRLPAGRRAGPGEGAGDDRQADRRRGGRADRPRDARGAGRGARRRGRSSSPDELLACAPLAVALAKRVMDASARPALAATLELEVVSQERCAASADFAEGARAFAEKREPEFSGR